MNSILFTYFFLILSYKYYTFNSNIKGICRFSFRLLSLFNNNSVNPAISLLQSIEKFFIPLCYPTFFNFWRLGYNTDDINSLNNNNRAIYLMNNIDENLHKL